MSSKLRIEFAIIHRKQNSKSLSVPEHMEILYSSTAFSSSQQIQLRGCSQAPPLIIAFDDVAFAYSGKKEDYHYEHISFGIECICHSTSS